MISIETWAYIRRRFFHDGMGVSAIARELELDRKTVRKAIATDEYLSQKQQKRSRSSKLDPFKPEIARILAKTPHLSGVRILEKLRGLGYAGGKTILFNPKFMAFVGYYMFKPEPCRPGMPHHKGRVERGVGYVKTNFLAGREHLLEEPFDLAMLNHECAKWMATKNKRIHATTRRQSAELLESERPHMLPLPQHIYDLN